MLSDGVLPVWRIHVARVSGFIVIPQIFCSKSHPKTETRDDTESHRKRDFAAPSEH